MKNKCKVCGANAESEYCFRHKPSKSISLKKKSSLFNKKLDKPGIGGTTFQIILSENWIPNLMYELFHSIWNKRKHVCEITGVSLGKESKSTFFHHILAKSKHPEAAFDEDNIILLAPDIHSTVELDAYKYPEINRRRDELMKKYNLV